jgi:hypothetical protein
VTSRPTILLILAAPVGILGYTAGAAVLSALPLPAGIHDFLVAFGPLFIAGLCMLPFLIPFFDRMAKRDLAEHRANAGSPANGDGAVAAPLPDERPQRTPRG